MTAGLPGAMLIPAYTMAGKSRDSCAARADLLAGPAGPAWERAWLVTPLRATKPPR
jgi:hypothetical protein